MLKTKLMTTASAVVVATGALSLGTMSAQAGQLKVEMADVNIQCQEIDTLHKDVNCSEVDINGFANPNTAGPTGKRSIDKGWIHVVKETGTFSHVAVADEREINENTPASGLYEVNLFEIESGSTFTPTIRVEIQLSGDADPWFKEDANCIDVLRAGSDNVFSRAAFKPSAEQDADGAIQADKNRAVCFISTTQTGSAAADSAIGFALPIKTKACGDMVIDMTVTRFVEGVGETGTETTGHLFQECKDSIDSYSGYYPTKVDYLSDFRSFLVDPNPHDDVEVHKASLWANTGFLQFDIHHNLTDLKWEGKGDEENVFDVSDIDTYYLEVQFDDLTGIKDFKLGGPGGMPGYLDRDNNVVYWELDEHQFAEKFCLGDTDNAKGTTDEGCGQEFHLVAYGPKDGSIYNGPIDHQELIISQSRIYFDDYETDGLHPAPFLAYEDEQVGAVVGHILKTGINFGPFDWSTSVGSMVNSIYRLTGVPEELKGNLKGSVTLENVSNGPEYKGVWKVDYPDVTGSHDLIITSGRLQQMLIDAGMPNDAQFGRADITFTLYVGGGAGFKLDMDRLLASNGTWADYGDNGNDGNSLKARSCDDGRFGPHVANKLDPRFQHYLTKVCGAGELRRRLRVLNDDTN